MATITVSASSDRRWKPGITSDIESGQCVGLGGAPRRVERFLFLSDRLVCEMGAREEILALEATWHVAPLAGDVETVSCVTADDWIGVAATGAMMGKADLLDMLSSRPAPFESTVYTDVQVQVYGQTGVVTSLFRGEGKDLDLVQRFMRVYAHRDGRWQCVATQVVPVPEEDAV
jgi:ketosteroid isomerase-like protein